MNKSIEQAPGITITLSTPEDYEACLHVQYKAALKNYPNTEIGITADDIESDYAPYLKEEAITPEVKRLSEHAPNLNHRQFIAKENDTVIGFCDVQEEDEFNQLLSFYVDPEYQSRGVGKTLWAEAQKVLAADKPTVVHVLPYNEQAIAFYETLGFQMATSVPEDSGTLMPSGAVMPKPVLMIRQ